MKLLVVSDEESESLWDFYTPDKLAGVDLMISCGDLKASYLTFLVTMSRARLLYVHGNHDGSYAKEPPEGCVDIDGHLVELNGYRILGLGGCLRYNPGPHQYTEREMKRRVRALRGALRRSGGVDVIVTHAPPRGHGDLDDPAHMGCEVFTELIEEFSPAYFFHGHTHLRFEHSLPREELFGGTRIINASERFLTELPDRVPKDPQAELKWYSRHKEREDDWNIFK